MTLLGLAAAALLAAPGTVALDSQTGATARFGEARVIEVRTGYFRRDLGNDPAYSNYQHYDRHKGDPDRRQRGFRLDPDPDGDAAGVFFFYDGGHSYIRLRGIGGRDFKHDKR